MKIKELEEKIKEITKEIDHLQKQLLRKEVVLLEETQVHDRLKKEIADCKTRKGKICIEKCLIKIEKIRAQRKLP